ncbi:MAG: hypothetical protein ACK479_12265 [Fluviicola sp.]
MVKKIYHQKIKALANGVVEIPPQFVGKFGFILPVRSNFYNIPNSDSTRVAITMLQNNFRLQDIFLLEDFGKIQESYTIYDIYGSYAQQGLSLDYLICTIDYN